MTRVTFLVHKGKEYTFQKYLASWGQELASRARVLNYPALRSTGRTPWKRLEQAIRSFRLGTLSDPGEPTGEGHFYVFTDVDRLDPRETETAVALYDRLAEHPDTLGILNHPTRSMRRYELLRTLRERGINRFGVHQLDGPIEPEHWPVFLRDDADHGFSSELLKTPRELERALARIEPAKRAEKILVEFCDTADDDGVIRKYGAFRVGERIVGRQIHFSRHWEVRFPDIKTAETAREELRYVERNPHADELMEIFELAGIEYGRVDYGLADGRIQVWEINTNPMILIPRDREDPLRFAAHDGFGRRFNAALEALLAAPDQ